MTAAAIATMATVDAARIIVPFFSVPLLLKRRWRSARSDRLIVLSGRRVRKFRRPDQVPHGEIANDQTKQPSLQYDRKSAEPSQLAVDEEPDEFANPTPRGPAWGSPSPDR